MLEEAGEAQWGRSFGLFKRYRVKGNGFWWSVVHCWGLLGREWFLVSFGDLDAEGNPLNFEVAADGPHFKTPDLSETSLREALGLALQIGPAHHIEGDWER